MRKALDRAHCGGKRSHPMNVNLKSLIGKLNDTTRNALEAAAGLCVSRTHYDIEIEHYLTEAAGRRPTATWPRILHALRRGPFAPAGGADPQPRQAEVAATPGRRRSARRLVNMMTEAWTIGSHRFRRGADPLRLHHPGAGRPRRTGAADERDRARSSRRSSRTRCETRFPDHRGGFARGLDRGAAAEARRAGSGAAAPAGGQDAEPGPIHRRSDRERARPGRSIRCWDATTRSAR